MSLIPRIPSESMSGVNRVIRAGRQPVFLAWLIILLIMAGQTVQAQAPVADFTANSTSGCAPLVVTFTDRSTGTPTSWNWGFSNGQLSNVQNPTVTFSTPGTYSVSLVVQNADGTHGITRTDYITVFPSPLVGFSSNITTGCVPVTIQFTDQTVPQAGNITSWEWHFGDGATSTQQNPQHTYTTVGFFNVTLKVTSSTGCSNSRTSVRYIRIVPGVTAQFSNTAPVRCTAPFAVSFQNLTSGPGNMSYEWDFGNSATSTATDPSTTYNNAGTFNVKLVARSQFGCADSITKPVSIIGYTTAINSPDQVCLNTPVNFQNGSSPAPVSSVWTFGNGRGSSLINDTSSYSAPGSYQVKLVNQYANCIDSVPKTITVLPLPVVDFTAPELIGCQAPHTVNFQDISPDAVAWQWDFGDGGTSTSRNPQHTYTDTGRYNVTLTITTSQGCQNTITKSGYIQIVKPEIRFNNLPNGGCIPFTFTPSATVSSIDGVATWQWDYGDGFIFNGQTPPAHLYPAVVDDYDFTLRITTNGGCTESLTIAQGILVGTPPVVNFTAAPTDVCAIDAITFTNTSTPIVHNYIWDFGDGNTSTNEHETHTYSDTGTFTVRLTGSYNRCLRFVEQTVHVRPPIADFLFGVDNCVDKRRVNFTDRSKTDPAYGPITYLWEFGDPANSTSTVQGNTSFTYPAIGDYTVRLTVTNGTCSFTTDYPVRLVGDVASFTVSKPRVCRDEQFTVTAGGSPQNIATYEWSVNGGPYVPGGRTLTTSFNTNGTYPISLRITDINGCQDIATQATAVTVTGPIANFSMNAGSCNNTVVTFNDLSTPAGSIREWWWNFDDRTVQTYTAPPFTHTFTDTGSYIIRLQVTDTNGCVHLYAHPNPLLITRPVAGFTSNYTNICPDVPVQFTDTSKGRSLTWQWDLGDGNTSALQNPAHTYTGNDSNYTVKLVVTDLVGCKDSVTKTNYIGVRSPKPAFTVTDTSTICPPMETKFTFQGQDFQSFYWDFGDGNTSTLPNTSNFYNAYGTYTATLHLTGYGGCQATASTVINVYNPNTSTSINFSPVRACNELTTTFNVTVPPSTAWTFFYGDGPFDNPSSPTFTHTYTSPNYYRPFVVLKDSLDCQITIFSGAQVEVIGAKPLFGKDKKAFCDSGMVTFTNYTLAPNDPVVNRVWDFGDGTTSGDMHPAHFYQQPGTYIVSQQVTTTLGCQNTIYDTVRVHGTPFTRILGDSIVCVNEILPLAGELIRPDSSITWSWNLGNGATGDDSSLTTKYTDTGFYNITLITSNLLNCRDTTYKPVYVPNNPVITVEKDPTIIVGNGITLPVTYSDSIATYAWTPPTRLSCTDCPMPYANPQFTTTYKVSVEDLYGCKSSRDITVTVICNNENYFIPNTFSPNGDGMNDVFAPRGRGIHRVNSMKIFNRWGELIWEKRNFMVNDRSPSGGWDGTYKGKPAQQDVYVYIIELVCDNAQIIPYKGDVTLIR